MYRVAKLTRALHVRNPPAYTSGCDPPGIFRGCEPWAVGCGTISRYIIATGHPTPANKVAWSVASQNWSVANDPPPNFVAALWSGTRSRTAATSAISRQAVHRGRQFLDPLGEM